MFAPLAPYATLIKIMAVLAFIAAIIFGIHHWKQSIINDTTNKVNATWMKREADADAAAQKILSDKNTQIAQHQAEIDSAFKIIVKKDKDIQNAKKDYESLRLQYANGDQRLSVRIADSTASDTAGQNSGSSTTGKHKYEVRELVPEVSGNILDFARDYSENLRKLNECRNLYNQVEKSVNQ